MSMNFLRILLNTRPNQELIETKKTEMKVQSRAIVKSLRKLDQTLQTNKEITHNIAIKGITRNFALAMGSLKYAK